MNSLNRSVFVAVPGVAQTYDAVTIRLHWITAALVAVLWGIAQIIDFFPKGSAKIAVRSLHILPGAVLTLVLLARFYWRMRHGRRLPPENPGILGYLAQGTHYLLYVALAATVALGLANVWVRGDTITGLLTVPQFAPGDQALKRLVEGLHGNFANAILIVACLHAAAALVHQYVLRDTVLSRMLPGRYGRLTNRRDR